MTKKREGAKRGRPLKADIEAAKKPGKLGRPVGTAGRVKEFHARLLATKGDKIIETVLRKALDDNDKDQVACIKMCVDRLLPLSYFEKKGGGHSGGINIQIVSHNGEVKTISNDEDTIDMELLEHDEEVDD